MRVTALLVAAALAGCDSAPDPVAARGVDIELATRALNRAFGAASLYVSMGVIAPTATAEQIATALSQRVTSETNGCATATVTGTVLDVDLSAGCTLGSAGATYSGTIHSTVSKTTEILVSSDLNLTIDGSALTGSFALSTTDGNTFTYGADLTFGGVEIKAANLRGGIAAMGATVTVAGGTIIGTSGTFPIDITGVHQRFGGCYPDEGTLQLMVPGAIETWQFAFETPQDGQAQVASGTVSPRSVTLPARPGCPTAATK